jgi:hypothetical protein
MLNDQSISNPYPWEVVMVPALYTSAEFNLSYAKMLLADIPDDAMARPAGPLVNHPAWQVGHLLWSFGGVAHWLGDTDNPPPAWALACAQGSKPSTDRAAFPAKSDMLATLESAHRRVIDLLWAAPADLLAAPMPDPKLRKVLPTIADAVVFVLTVHCAAHLGQLSAWRRATGLGEALRF